ncbi:SRPBCC family protein [Ruicaihuangia caeni]|uniref:SRPBCC family protein n=1 Tax=Ruicaihuangia caeni TaxID=3042517 RepID=A0AAW6T875_9MICO|nr:SRPBCC family protein [Klugiella sp. YN-L-19]MDI2098951.1 SRPBCC family protein [Klugiella sp. YN-L-19]
MSNTTNADVEIDAPVETVYTQWRNVDAFPGYFPNVKSVRRIDADTTHWAVTVGGVEREFDARTTDSVPNQRISWTSTGDTEHQGRVIFSTIDGGRTRVEVEVDWEPEGFVEKVGAVLHVDAMQLKTALGHFKDFVEHHMRQSGMATNEDDVIGDENEFHQHYPPKRAGTEFSTDPRMHPPVDPPETRI